MAIDYTVDESRYLISTLSAILNDKKPMSSLNRVNWSTIFRLANINRIANILYYAILGSDEKMTEDVKKGFYNAFTESLVGYDRISTVQEALFWKLDMEEINTVVFRMASFNELYPMKEMGIPDALELFIPDTPKEKIDELMRSMDFVPSNIKVGEGIIYSRNPKCEIKIYFNSPFYDNVMQKYFKASFSKLSYINNYKSIRGFDTDNYYVLLISLIANSYAIKTLKIRQLLDLWVFYKKYYEDFNWDYITAQLEAQGISELCHRLLELCFIWFDGATVDKTEDLDLYDNMEQFVLSRGEIGFKESCDYFPLVFKLNKLIIQEQERQEKEKYRRFLYPDADYMRSLYPNLAKTKAGLSLAYIIRRIRLLFINGNEAQEEIERIESGIEFYEPQSSYPDNFLDTEETDVEPVKTAPLMVSGEVQIMDDVLPVNNGNTSAVGGSSSAGYLTEEELMNMQANSQNNSKPL